MPRPQGCGPGSQGLLGGPASPRRRPRPTACRCHTCSGGVPRRPGSPRSAPDPPVLPCRAGLPLGSTGGAWRPCSKRFRLMALLLQKSQPSLRARLLPPPFADQKRPREAQEPSRPSERGGWRCWGVGGGGVSSFGGCLWAVGPMGMYAWRQPQGYAHPWGRWSPHTSLGVLSPRFLATDRDPCDACTLGEQYACLHRGLLGQDPISLGTLSQS